MKIAVHASHLNNEKWDGTKVYLLNVLKELKALDKYNQYYLYFDSPPRIDGLEADNFKIRISRRTKFWTQLKFPFELRKDKPDVLWMPLQMMPYLHDTSIKSVITIHDLAYYQFPQAYTKFHYNILKYTTQFAIKKADALIAVSESTRKDVLVRFEIPKEKIHTIHHGFNRYKFKPYHPSKRDYLGNIKDKFGINKPYFLFVGGIRLTKNIHRIIRAFNLYRERETDEVQLVIAGPKAWKFENIFETYQQSKYKRDIIIIGQVDDKEKQALYWGAEVFVFPSLWEGFGIPILEAQASGIPIITSYRSSMPEVAGKGALFVDPYSVDEIYSNLRKIVTNAELKKDLIKKGFYNVRQFSWQKTALQTLDLIIKTVIKKDSTRKNHLVIEAQKLITEKLKSLQVEGCNTDNRQ